MESVESEQAAADRKTAVWIARYGQVLTFLLAQVTAVVACVCLFLMLSGQDQAKQGEIIKIAVMLVGGCLAITIAIVYRIVAVPANRSKAIEAYGVSGDQPALPIHTDRPLSGPLEVLLLASTAATHKSQVFFGTSACINLILMYLDESWVHLPLAFASVLFVVWQTPTVGRLANLIKEALGQQQITREAN